MFTNQQKTILFWISIVFVAVLILYFLSSIQQKSEARMDTMQVSFQGSGKVYVKPDVAVVDFSIVTSGRSSMVAQDSNSQISQKVTDFLKQQKIADKDIKTTYYNLVPQYVTPTPMMYAPMSSPVPVKISPESYMNYGGGVSYPSSVVSSDSGIPKISGYQVTQGYEIKIRDFAKASSIVDGLTSVGVNQITNLSFQIDNPDKAKAEARALAIADAKKKAKELKGQIGIRLGKIINFYEDYYPTPYYAKSLEAGMGGAGGTVAGPDLAPGVSEVMVNVTLVYQIR